jgi:hypothetical protein
MKKRGKKMVILLAIVVLIGIILVYFNIPYSPVKQSFNNKVNAAIAKQPDLSSEKFTKEDFAHLPLPVQKYMEHCGYIGKPKMSYMKIPFYDVDFMQGREGKKLVNNYTQYDFVKAPDRYALIESRMMGIPFEGLDSFTDGVGGMKGTLAKSITLFNETGTDMDKACLVTYLAESLFIPTSLLQGYITLEEIDDYHVKGIISYNGVKAEGIFTFNEKYEMISFETNDRVEMGTNGNIEYVPWLAICKDYEKNENGYIHPTVFQGVRRYDDGDFLYFDGKLEGIEYR